ncbi:MAG TPA: hypothetical protein DEP28_03835 [Bacteroidetes bacterium]|nr:hypothetical protein [Bacteroidota bacterium]HCN38493.1 hypothetical protein [Bacteroidota bacterium]
MEDKLTLDILGLTETHKKSYKPDKLRFLDYNVNKRSFINFSKNVSVPQMKLANWLSVSLRTLQRYPYSKELSNDVKEKLFSLADLYSKGIKLMGKDNFNKWLEKENRGLGNVKPSDLLSYYSGIEEVKNILERISHGVYS